MVRDPGRPPAEAEDRGVRRMERLVGRALQAGVWASAALIVAGSILAALRRTGAEELAELVGARAGFHPSLAWLSADLLAGGGTGLVVLGLLLLLATPVLRVAISIGLFARQGDRTYVLLTSGVLVLLLASFLLGRAGS